MYLYGAGGHAKSVRDILESMGINIDAVYDDNPQTEKFMEKPVVHSLVEAKEIVICIGDNRTRKAIAERLIKNQIVFGKAIHPSATVSPYATIGEGTVVMPGAFVNSGAKIGKHCIVNTGAVIEHDCVLGDYSHIASNATLGGGVNVGEGCLIGTGAVVIQGINIGKWTTIGVGSVVVRDIPEGVIAFGIPCKVRNIKTGVEEQR